MRSHEFEEDQIINKTFYPQTDDFLKFVNYLYFWTLLSNDTTGGAPYISSPQAANILYGHPGLFSGTDQ